MDELITTTDSAYAFRVRLRQSVIIGVCMTLCNLFSLTVSFSLFLMIEVVIAAVIFLCVQLPRNNQDWTLHFQNDELHVKNNVTGAVYEIYAIPTTDFRFRQSKAEKELDYVNLTFRRISLGFPAVKNASAVKDYVQVHFSRYG